MQRVAYCSATRCIVARHGPGARDPRLAERALRLRARTSPAGSTGRSGSSGPRPTSRSTACSPAWRATAGSGSTQVAQQGRPDKKVYDVTAAGRRELERWLAEPLDREQHRSDLAVKLRAASYGDRGPLLDEVAALRAEHATRLALFEQLEARDYPDPARLDGADLDQYLVLRGGIRMEQFWVDWLGEYLAAHGTTALAHRTSDEGAP